MIIDVHIVATYPTCTPVGRTCDAWATLMCTCTGHVHESCCPTPPTWVCIYSRRWKNMLRMSIIDVHMYINISAAPIRTPLQPHLSCKAYASVKGVGRTCDVWASLICTNTSSTPQWQQSEITSVGSTWVNMWLMSLMSIIDVHMHIHEWYCPTPPHPMHMLFLGAVQDSSAKNHIASRSTMTLLFKAQPLHTFWGACLIQSVYLTVLPGQLYVEQYHC